MQTDQLTYAPPVLIVDDRPENLEVRMIVFRAEGFAPIGAQTLSEALLQLRSNPGIALLATDINLDPDRPGNRDGITLTREVRQWLPHLPIVGVSALFDEHGLAEEERALFDDIHLKGDLHPINEKVPGWKCKAISYISSRPSRALEELDRLRGKYQIDPSDFSLMREFVPLINVPASTRDDVEDRSTEEMADDASAESIEQNLAQLGYKLKIIERSDIPSDCTDEGVQVGKAIPVWVHSDGLSSIVVELYGFPQIYAHGATEGDAIASLLFLMAGYHEDFLSEPNASQSAGIRRLQEYLASVFA